MKNISRKQGMILLLFCLAITIFFIFASGVVRAEAEEFKSSRTMSMMSENDLLQDSTLVSFKDVNGYNCYAYAIDLTDDLQKYRPEIQEPNYLPYQPGDVSGMICDVTTMTLLEIAQIVKADLEMLGYTDIRISTGSPDDLYITNKLICFRTGLKYTNKPDKDCHFMKYENGAWYHKPAAHSILKYKYQPSDDRFWTNEYIDNTGRYHSGTIVYDSPICYITYSDSNIDLAKDFAGGNGINSPFLIETEEQLLKMRLATSSVYIPGGQGTEERITYSFKLMKDVVLSGDWQPPLYKFAGYFDGNGYSICYDMEISAADLSNDNQGFFGYVVSPGRIEDIEFINCSISNEGALDGNGETAIGIVAGTIYNAGGLKSVKVINSSIDCNIQGAPIGGLAGSIHGTLVQNCHVTGGNFISYSGALGGMAGLGEIGYFSAGVCNTTLTKYNYSDGDLIGPVVGNSENTSTVDCSVKMNKNENNCIAEGTLITLADGSQVPVEELQGDEMLLVWNFYTGSYDYAPLIFIDSDPEKMYEVIHLSFSDGTSVDVISEHGFWNYNLNCYVYLDKNAAQYIGHWFRKIGQDCADEKVQLIDVSLSYEHTTAYSPVTYGHLCYYVNGMLSVPGGIDGLFNIFAVNDRLMQYDTAKMMIDIQEYGLFTYEEFAETFLVSEEVFVAFNGQYLKVAIGKGLISEDIIAAYIEKYNFLLS